MEKRNKLPPFKKKSLVTLQVSYDGIHLHGFTFTLEIGKITGFTWKIGGINPPLFGWNLNGMDSMFLGCNPEEFFYDRGGGFPQRFFLNVHRAIPGDV